MIKLKTDLVHGDIFLEETEGSNTPRPILCIKGQDHKLYAFSMGVVSMLSFKATGDYYCAGEEVEVVTTLHSLSSMIQEALP